MKIIYVKGDLFTCPEIIIAHGCNTQGVMGAGVAAGIRDKFPEAYDVYRSSDLTLGQVLPAASEGKLILNLMTQDRISGSGRRVSYDAVDRAISLVNYRYPGHRIAMPKIGAGLGGGDWNVISAIIESRATQFQPVVYVP